MKLDIPQDTLPISEFKRNTKSVLNFIHKSRRPVVLTAGVNAEAVLIDVKEYEKIS